MQRLAMVVGFLMGVFLLTPAQAQQYPPWWLWAEAGDGFLELSSDQHVSHRRETLALGFAGGRQFRDRARIGIMVDGWLLQVFNFNDPTAGESISDVMGIIDVLPIHRKGLFLRGGVGVSIYTNDRPNETGGHGLSWLAGGGYELPLKGRLGLVPMVDYGYGGLGDARNAAVYETGRRYSVIEVKAALIYHFGDRR